MRIRMTENQACFTVFGWPLERLWDKRKEADGALSDSDDEDDVPRRHAQAHKTTNGTANGAAEDVEMTDASGPGAGDVVAQGA
jgi:hypothetical protein